MTICEDPPAKVFGRGEVGVDAKGDGNGPPAKFFGEGVLKKGALVEAMLVKSLKMVVTPVGKGNADVGTDAASEGRRSHVKMHLS